MVIILESMELENFKGIRSASYQFSLDCEISGENGCGKTTVFDAFCWLLFGRDSLDRADFSIKTLDEEGRIIPMLDHRVSANFSVDGKRLSLERIMRERWVNADGKGARAKEDSISLKGNEIIYIINSVPVKKEEFTRQVSELGGKGELKLLVNPLCFVRLPWQDARKLLMSFLGDNIEPEEIMSNSSLSSLIEEIGGKDISKVRTEIATKLKLLEKEAELLLPRIDEVKRTLDTTSYEDTEARLAAKKEELKSIERLLLDTSLIKESEALNSLKDEYRRALNKRAEYESQRAADKRLKRILTDRVRVLEDEQTRLEAGLTENSGKIADTAISEVDENSLSCPYCKRELQEEEKAKVIKNFEAEKHEKIRLLTEKGLRLEKDLTKLKAELQDSKKRAEEIIISDEADFSYIEKMAEEIEFLQTKANHSDVKDEIRKRHDKVFDEVRVLQERLVKQRLNEAGKKRLEELEEKHSGLLKEITSLENKDKLLIEIISIRSRELEKRLNSNFKITSFKLFEPLINGGVNQCCVPMVDGVPYADLNGAGKVNCALDIINTLSRHFGVIAPVFIDNSESITKPLEVMGQAIRLKVRGEAK